MADSVTLLMAIHCHQPVGNFGFVFERAYEEAYEPFLAVLERHPGVRLALHYSGCLLDWLLEHRPEFVGRIRVLVQRGQIELLASGYYEPILPMIPRWDRLGQIGQMRTALRTHCGADVSGLWLTERVWEPELPATMAEAGIRYTMVDVNQFASAKPWLPSALQVDDGAFWDLLGSYMTEYAGSAALVFPASKRLRYWLPFQPVGRTIDFLSRLRREEAPPITFADDGEKFGLWPQTHRWVYDQGWLEQFFAALERERSWLTTTTFHDYAESAEADGRVYLPCGSYEEMLEWSGGHFRNFFVKYPEANAMQQKMIALSRALAELMPGRPQRRDMLGGGGGSRAAARLAGRPPAVDRQRRLLQQAQRELYMGQCNCAYWHGVFGGLYLSHLRREVYAHLIASERLINRALGRTRSASAMDCDGDGRQEARLTNARMGLLVDPDEGGTLTEWSLYAAGVNVLDTLSRRYEPYHDKLKARPVGASAPVSGGAPASIHDVLGVKEGVLASSLVYDEHRRSGFIDHALQSMPTLDEIVSSTWGERRLWSGGAFHWERGPLGWSRNQPLRVTMTRQLPAAGAIRKTVGLHGDRAVLECLYELDGMVVPVVGIEFNLSLRDERYLAESAERQDATDFHIQEEAAGVSLRLTIDPPGRLVHFPIETVSESEGGLERTYQGLALVCLWTAGDSRSWVSRLRWEAETR